jgi:hypothetical protein
MKKNKTLFVDLLYSNNGSMDEDMRCIAQALGKDQNIEYLHFDAKKSILAVLGLYLRVLIHRPEKVVLLSSKISQMLALLPITLLSKCYAVYHYMPRHRQTFHQRSLKFIKRYFVVGVYAEGVAKEIEALTGFHPPVIPSRIVNRIESLKKLRNKISERKINVLVPGVRRGVRTDVKLAPIIQKLQNLDIGVNEILIQGDISFTNKNCGLVRRIGKVPQVEYDNLYISSLIVAIEFDRDYEVRASGVILDAIRSGCLVLSSNHNIIQQYGFPSTIVTDLEHLESVLATITHGSDEQALELIPGLNLDEFETKWRSFLN